MLVARTLDNERLSYDGSVYIRIPDGIAPEDVVVVSGRSHEELLEALQCLARIADAYDDNALDNEARKTWGVNDEYQNHRKPEEIELFQGRGGKQLMTLADCFFARTAIANAEGEAK